MEVNTAWVDGLFGCARRLVEGGRRHLVTRFDPAGTIVAERASDDPTAADAVAGFAPDAGPGTLVVATWDHPGQPDPFNDVGALTVAVEALNGPVLGAWLLCDDEGVDICLPPKEVA